MTPQTAFRTDFRFDCSFCDAELRSATAEELKLHGRRHLKSHDFEELSTAFADTYGGEDCRNGCGYVYPADGAEIEGFRCPRCEFDHRHAFAKRYLYWCIEFR